MPRIKRDRVANHRYHCARQVRVWSIQEFHDRLKQADINRAFVIFENGVFHLSHPQLLAPLQAFFELSQNFDQHEAVFIGRDPELESLFFAFVHDTRRGLAQGGLRFSHYENLAELLEDGLRLSQGMTRKNALAGLWWGGGKGIMTLPPGYKHPAHMEQGAERTDLFKAYGRFVASLSGVYYTAEDVGTVTADMNAVLSTNRFTTCIAESYGGSGNPSPFTAWGVLRAMQAAWLVMTGVESLAGVKVAVQGAGNVGAPLIRYLDEAGACIWFCDVNPESIERLTQERPHLQVVPPEVIFDLDVDVFAPCARGAQINAETIPRLKASLVCGAANNILKEPEADAERLRQHNIAFVPDYVCNRMGIVNCADEWQGYLTEDIRIAAERVFPDTLRVFKYARMRGSTTTQASRDLADIAACELHPMLGHRGRRIVDALIQSGWHLPQATQLPNPLKKRLAFVPVLDEPYIRLAWERDEQLQGSGLSIAATPISAASPPSLDSFLSPLLLDIRARSEFLITGRHPRRLLGIDHGGLSLQVAVERNCPYEREDIGRPEFVEMCHDLYSRHDANIREQLHHLGVGFDPRSWLDPMSETGQKAVRHLFEFLNAAELLTRANSLAYHCPRCQTILVSSEISRSKYHARHNYHLHLDTPTGEKIPTSTFFPEYILGAVALAVSPKGQYAHYIGNTVMNPANGDELPVIAVPYLTGEAEFIVPLISRYHTKIARRYGLTSHRQIFDRDGNACIPGYESLGREETRKAVLAHFKEYREELGSWHVNVLRCQRCEAIVIPRYSEQFFLKVAEGIPLLIQAIEDQRIRFSHPDWQQRVIEHLKGWELWCISRQYWWGNAIPESHQGEVFSIWFSLVAWVLSGSGWPDNPKPKPIQEVFVNNDFLFRWVLPTQVIALLITGRPAFEYIYVHGSLHVSERQLKPLTTDEQMLPDEARFLFNTVKRPMQRRFGNVTEPAALIRRFGSDALRLGYLLSMESEHQEVITASESRLRQARHALQRLVSKVTGIMGMIKPPIPCGDPHFADRWILAHCRSVSEEARLAYQEYRLSDVGRLFVALIEDFIHYINTVAWRQKHKGDIGAARATVAAVILQMREHFSPVCPFVFEKLKDWIRRQSPETEPLPDTEPWYEELVSVLCNMSDSVEIVTKDPAVKAWLQNEVTEIGRITKCPITVSEHTPSEHAQAIGPVWV